MCALEYNQRRGNRDYIVYLNKIKLQRTKESEELVWTNFKLQSSWQKKSFWRLAKIGPLPITFKACPW